jgi:hypothetical protein
LIRTRPSATKKRLLRLIDPAWPGATAIDWAADDVRVVDHDWENDCETPRERPSEAMPIEMSVPIVTELPTASESVTVCVCGRSKEDV